MKTWAPIVALLVLAPLAGVGCSEESIKPQEESTRPPELPPVESMRFDLGLFRSPTVAQAGAPGGQPMAEAAGRSNWINAAIRVVFVDLVLADAFGPAVFAFAAAANTTPVAEGDSVFVWTYVWRESPGHDITIHLRGRIDGLVATWRLLVTDLQADPPLEEWEWFWGRRPLLRDEGFWLFHALDEGRTVPAARIDWKVTDRVHRELSFECIMEGGDDYGDKATFRRAGRDCSLSFYDASTGITSEIRWDEATGAGSLQVPDYNGGERACWDENQLDVECPGPAL